MGQQKPSAFLQAFWDRLATSLWFVPALMIFGAVILAGAALLLDVRMAGWNQTKMPWWIYQANTEDARTILSTLLSSMITMTSLVFSITMVVLTLAANQFGPRLIRSFMASRQTQFVLGTFVMTIIYCLILLSAIGWRNDEEVRPFATLSIAIVLTILSVILLVVFIHALALSIMSETLVDRVAGELDAALDELRPLSPSSHLEDNPEDHLPSGFQSEVADIEATSSGYIQAIEFQMIIAIAEKSDTVIALYAKPGDFLGRGDCQFGIYPRWRCSDQLASDIRGAIKLGIQRTPVQDLEFSIRQLVEMAVRALSPGINDPYTAAAVIYRLSAALSNLMGRALPQAVYRDSSGTVRLLCPVPSYRSLITASFSQIRQAGARKPLIAIHLIEAITRISRHMANMDQAKALSDQLQAIIDAARPGNAELDVAVIEDRAETAWEAIELARLRLSSPEPE